MAPAGSSRSSDFFAGVPVAVDPALIEKELAALWKPMTPEAKGASAGANGDSAVTRACLSNLMVYLPDESSRERAAGVLQALGRRFPSRMLLLTQGEPAPGKEKLSTWITAVCHVTRPGAPPVCCEEIILETEPESLDLLRGAVTPLLVPDLPVVLAFFTPADEKLLGIVGDVLDRVIFDSRRLPLGELKRMERLMEGAAVKSFEDLAWRETGLWRRVLCDIFEEAPARPILSGLREVEVHYQQNPAGAALIAGWLASRLGWQLEKSQVQGGEWKALFKRDGQRLEVLLRRERAEEFPSSVVAVRLRAGKGSEAPFVAVWLGGKGDFLRIEYSTKEACVLPRTLPFRQETDADLLGLALEHPTHQEVFRDALRVASRFV